MLVAEQATNPRLPSLLAPYAGSVRGIDHARLLPSPPGHLGVGPHRTVILTPCCMASFGCHCCPPRWLADSV